MYKLIKKVSKLNYEPAEGQLIVSACKYTVGLAMQYTSKRTDSTLKASKVLESRQLPNGDVEIHTELSIFTLTNLN